MGDTKRKVLYMERVNFIFRAIPLVKHGDITAVLNEILWNGLKNEFILTQLIMLPSSSLQIPKSEPQMVTMIIFYVSCSPAKYKQLYGKEYNGNEHINIAVDVKQTS